MCLDCGCQLPGDDHGDDRHITLMKLNAAAEATGVRLSTAVCNINDTVANCCKSHPESRSDITGLVIKADDSKRFLLTVAYPAYKFDVAVAADGHMDVATEDVVERACWSFMRKGARLGMWHEAGHADAGEVVENYIHRGSPWVIKAADGTDHTIMPGDWLVGIVCSEHTWALYKSNAIGGVSPQGGARRRLPSADTLARVQVRSGSHA